MEQEMPACGYAGKEMTIRPNSQGGVMKKLHAWTTIAVVRFICIPFAYARLEGTPWLVLRGAGGVEG